MQAEFLTCGRHRHGEPRAARGIYYESPIRCGRIRSFLDREVHERRADAETGFRRRHRDVAHDAVAKSSPSIRRPYWAGEGFGEGERRHDRAAHAREPARPGCRWTRQCAGQRGGDLSVYVGFKRTCVGDAVEPAAETVRLSRRPTTRRRAIRGSASCCGRSRRAGEARRAPERRSVLVAGESGGRGRSDRARAEDFRAQKVARIPQAAAPGDVRRRRSIARIADLQRVLDAHAGELRARGADRGGRTVKDWWRHGGRCNRARSESAELSDGAAERQPVRTNGRAARGSAGLVRSAVVIGHPMAVVVTYFNEPATAGEGTEILVDGTSIGLRDEAETALHAQHAIPANLTGKQGHVCLATGNGRIASGAGSERSGRSD